MGSPLNPFNLGLFNSGTYTPNVCTISAITQANPATITTIDDQNFVVGNQVQFFIPNGYGMTQLNNAKGYVTSIIDDTDFIVAIDTSAFDAFAVPMVSLPVVIDPAQVVSCGDFNTGTLAPGGILPLPQTIPGAFENQPP